MERFLSFCILTIKSLEFQIFSVSWLSSLSLRLSLNLFYLVQFMGHLHQIITILTLEFLTFIRFGNE